MFVLSEIQTLAWQFICDNTTNYQTIFDKTFRNITIFITFQRRWLAIFSKKNQDYDIDKLLTFQNL